MRLETSPETVNRSTLPVPVFIERLGGLREAFGCRLCRRIALAVFGLILFIESLILVPSALRFERVELRRLDNVAVTAVESVLMLYPERGGIEAIRLGFGRVVGGMGLLGLAALAPDEAPIAQAGETIEGMASAASRKGVETREQLAFLGARGCDEIQGYLFGRPETATKFEALHLSALGTT